MKSTIFFLLCALIIIADSIGTRRNVNSSHLESKILYGRHVAKQKHKYIASLQLNGVHICSSGFFQEGFLLTTGTCAYNMLKGMTKEGQAATALLGDSDLEKGRRVVILDVSYTSKKKLDDYDLGLVMLPDNVDYKHIEILPLYKKPTNLYRIGLNAVVCGWKTISQDDVLAGATQNAQYLQNLHCTDLNLLGSQLCRQTLIYRDFREKLVCGEALGKYQKFTLGDVGNPLIKEISENNVFKKYIIGVALPRYQFQSSALFNFVRISYGFPFIKKMIKDLRCHEELYTNFISINSSSSENDSLNKPCKRQKVKRTRDKRAVYTGKEYFTKLG